MNIDVILIKEIQHGNLSLISSGHVDSIIAHLNLGIIIKDNAALDNFAKLIVLIHEFAGKEGTI